MILMFFQMMLISKPIIPTENLCADWQGYRKINSYVLPGCHVFPILFTTRNHNAKLLATYSKIDIKISTFSQGWDTFHANAYAFMCDEVYLSARIASPYRETGINSCILPELEIKLHTKKFPHTASILSNSFTHPLMSH